MDLVINRAKWRCGGENGVKTQRGVGETLLLNNDGAQCCLGQISQQVGISKKEILNSACPGDLSKKIPLLSNKSKVKGYFEDSSLSEQAMEINDDITFNDKEREQKLKLLFSKYKHKLEFKGLYRDSNGKVLKVKV